MKAIRFEQYGKPAQVLTVQQCPLPEPGKREVRVRMLASPINPSDLLFVRGHYAGVEPHFPAPVGFEGVGIVEALGPQAQRPVPDQRVVVRNGQGGTWADYAVVSAQDLLPVPDDLADEQAACFTINPASAAAICGQRRTGPHDYPSGQTRWHSHDQRGPSARGGGGPATAGGR